MIATFDRLRIFGIHFFRLRVCNSECHRCTCVLLSLHFGREKGGGGVTLIENGSNY